MISLFLGSSMLGLIIMVVGTTVSYLFGKTMMKVELPPVCKDWNKNYIMEASLFMTGAVSYVILEYVTRFLG